MREIDGMGGESGGHGGRAAESLRSPTGFAGYLAGAGQPRGEGPIPNLLVLAAVGSTNVLGRRILDTYLADDLSPPTLGILAFAQSAGRGRLGRVWTSPPGDGVWATLVAAVTPSCLPRLPLLVGVALVETLVGTVGPGAGEIRLKWPNDLVFGSRKLGGILIEAVQRSSAAPAAVIGFGLNVTNAPVDVPHAVALGDLATGGAGGAEVSAGDLGRRLLEAVASALRAGDEVDWVARYTAWSAHTVGDRMFCRVGEATIEGTFSGFDEEGRLRLATSGGERLVASGEVIE